MNSSSLVMEYERMRARAERAEALIDEALEALSWASGASDFQQGGVAEKGWERVARPVLDKILAARSLKDIARQEHSTLADKMKNEPGIGRPRIVTLCGSTRFKDEFLRAQRSLTLAGEIVLTVGHFHHSDPHPITADQKQALDELHFRKIEMSDAIFVVNPGGYIGESTRNEIACALRHGKRIEFLDEMAGQRYLTEHS